MVKTAQKKKQQPKRKRVAPKKATAKKEYVENPSTGKMILVGGATYKVVFGKTGGRKKQTRTQADLPVPASLIKEILAMETTTKEELEDLLERTTQPALRVKIQEQIKNKSNPRGQSTRGWAAAAPSRGVPRKVLHDVCHDAAFLMPEHLMFPIMPKCGNGNEPSKCSCKIDCRALQAAYNRARQHKYTNVAAAAMKLLKAKCKKSAEIIAAAEA